MIWFDWVLWHINHCRLFNSKSSLYIYIKYISFALFGFYGISTPCRLFDAKSCFYIFIKYIIIIIIMSCWKHGYPWSSLATFPYRSSPQAGLLDNILYPHIVAECMFVLVVLLLHGHVWGSVRVHHLWVRPCFSSSVLHVWFV